MDRLAAMRLFVRITQYGTFAQAAGSLGISSATATERIRALESDLKAKLLNRTTRRLSLTPEGERYLATCRKVLDELEEIERSISEDSKLRRGPVTISANVGVFRSILLPKIAAFAEAHPEIRLQIFASDQRANFVRDGIDFAIRVGRLEDQELIARRVGEPRRVTVASPDYLRRHGVPRTPAELAGHRLIDFLLPGVGRALDWDFAESGGLRQTAFNGPIAVNDAEARVRFAEDGAGIAQTMCFLASPGLKSGRLVRLLAEWETPAPAISILYPRNRHMPARVRATVDFVASTIEEALATASRSSASRPRGRSAKRSPPG
jgi:LysR family transcriptional regulator for bpeEF and oprC